MGALALACNVLHREHFTNSPSVYQYMQLHDVIVDVNYFEALIAIYVFWKDM